MSGQELVDKLRATASTWKHSKTGKRITRAADRIEALEAELATVTADRDYMVINAEGLHRSGVELKARAERAEQERDAARSAQDFWRQRAAELEAELEAESGRANDEHLKYARTDATKQAYRLRAERAELKSAELAAVIAEVRELSEAISRDSHCSYLGRDIRELLPADSACALSAYTTRIREEAAEEFIVWLVETLHYPFDMAFETPPPVDNDRLADHWNEHDNWGIPAEDARACVREEAGVAEGSN